MALATSQIQAACVYSPPPVLSHGQGADTLGEKRTAVAAEAGWGTVASWWNADNLSDVDINSGFVGVGRVRYGLKPDLDVGGVGALGPHGTFVIAPEVKWRIARFAPRDAEGAPGFHAAVISGLGVGTAEYRLDQDEEDESAPRYVFVAPYTGILASGGIQVVQMFSGFRFAASETFGNDRPDLTLYPVLAFGVLVRPNRAVTFYAEGDLAGGITTHDFSDSALIGYPSVGVSVTLDEL
jgi:hypothetical protein